MIELKESKEFLSREKSSNTRKSSTPRESPSKELSLTTMLSKLKFNIFLKKLKKLLLNMSPSRELGNVFNICPLKPKLFTTQSEKNTLSAKVSTLLPHRQLSKRLHNTLPANTPPVNTQQVHNTQQVDNTQRPTKPQLLPIKQQPLPQLLIKLPPLPQLHTKPIKLPQFQLATLLEPNTKLWHLLTLVVQELAKALSQELTELDPTTSTLQEDPSKPAPTPQPVMLNHWAAMDTPLRTELT